jgi:hypothetical protein
MKNTHYLIKYTSKETITGAQRMMIQRRLHGYKDCSNKHKYVYDRKGLLEIEPCIKLARGVYIVNASTAEKIKDILGSWCYVFCREVILDAEDKKQLSKKPKPKHRLR